MSLIRRCALVDESNRLTLARYDYYHVTLSNFINPSHYYYLRIALKRDDEANSFLPQNALIASRE
jgi:hypothetical protein